MGTEVTKYDPKELPPATATATARALVVDDDQTYELCITWAKNIAARRKAIDEKRRSYVDPLNAVVKNINADFKKVTDDYDTAIEIAKTEAHRYLIDKEKAATALRIESERMAAEARAAAEAEAKKVEVAQPEVAAIIREAATAITAPEVGIEKPDGGGHTRKVWKAKLTSFEVLCIAAGSNRTAQNMLEFDQAAANRIAAATKGPCPFPGVEFYEDSTMVLR